MTADEFNAKYPEGTRVKYHPTIGRDENCLITKTRSEAWELGHGDAVVAIEGKAGGVSLRALTILD